MAILVVWRPFPRGRVGIVDRLLWGQARLCVGADAALAQGVFEDEWHYASVGEAMEALQRWSGQGEPAGWFRHPASGRRRPGGDPGREYVRP